MKRISPREVELTQDEQFLSDIHGELLDSYDTPTAVSKVRQHAQDAGLDVDPGFFDWLSE